MEKTKWRTALRETWHLVKPYWTSSDRWKGGLLLLVIIGLSLGSVYVNVRINQWNNVFYNALQHRNTPAFWHLLLRFGELAFAAIIMSVYQLYLSQMLEIRWRQWLTEYYLEHWMKNRVHYTLQLADEQGDNPDQRISEDLRQFVSQTLNLSLGLLSSVVTLVSFVGILWGLSGIVHIPVFGHTLALAGSMVWAGLFYAVVGTWLTHALGRPLIGLNFNQQRYEADFRFNLVRFRENSEGVALHGGEDDEKERFRGVFSHVVRNWWGIMRRQKRLTWFTASYNQLAIIYPFVVAAPRYLLGKFSLGQLMQTASAFGQVQSSLSFIVDSYPDLAQWRAVVQRLAGFRRAVDAAAGDTLDGVETGLSDGQLHVAIDTIRTPAGNTLMKDLELKVRPGERVLLTGPSGFGKTTLFRLLAGIWPYARARIRYPRGSRLFLPQHPYLPVGTLRQVVTYPAAGDCPDSRVRDALQAVGMERLGERLDEQGHWAQKLSPGEQQRLAIARALVNRPDWLFLDEATSALDEDAEKQLYEALERELPRTTVISIGHRHTLRRLHERVVELTRGEGPATSPDPA